ncbi:hypothetical protein [Sphingomonas sp. NFR04]|uniref:hypothetical protein n=1 Tax=Sphingomonas sp. NFR04 TaxID=1566283 RepID=UPI0011134ED7|nr:hypothetical protein [Sphingomonas sp. NFR04]
MLLDVCGEVDGAGDGVELTEIRKLNQRFKQGTVNLDTVRYTVNAKSRLVRFQELQTIYPLSSSGSDFDAASSWAEMQPFESKTGGVVSLDR